MKTAYVSFYSEKDRDFRYKVDSNKVKERLIFNPIMSIVHKMVQHKLKILQKMLQDF